MSCRVVSCRVPGMSCPCPVALLRQVQASKYFRASPLSDVLNANGTIGLILHDPIVVSNCLQVHVALRLTTLSLFLYDRDDRADTV